MLGMRSSSEPYAQLLAQTLRARFGTHWAIAETEAPKNAKAPTKAVTALRVCRKFRVVNIIAIFPVPSSVNEQTAPSSF
jgi:hypothetical protein